MAKTDSTFTPTIDTSNGKEKKLSESNEKLDSQLPASTSESTRYYLGGISFLLLQVLVLSAFAAVYISAHGINFLEILLACPNNMYQSL